MVLEDTKTDLQIALPAWRYRHSLAVAQVAAHLGQRYGVDQKQAYLAGLLHDCAKGLGKDELLQTALAFGIVKDDVEQLNPDLLHGPVGALLAWKKYNVSDINILRAIAEHTLGARKMSTLSKIVYLADLIEPNRDFKEVQYLRNLAQKNLNLALLKAMDYTILFLIEQSLPLHPETVRARNSLLAETAALTWEREEENGPQKEARCSKV